MTARWHVDPIIPTSLRYDATSSASPCCLLSLSPFHVHESFHFHFFQRSQSSRVFIHHNFGPQSPLNLIISLDRTSIFTVPSMFSSDPAYANRDNISALISPPTTCCATLLNPPSPTYCSISHRYPRTSTRQCAPASACFRPRIPDMISQL